jgi:hypothetical protein
MPPTTIKHGAILNAVSREEVEQLLQQYTTRQQTRERVRAPATTILDATGAGLLEVYIVPIGWELEVRRVQFDLSTVNETNVATASVSLNTPGFAVQYLRSGTRIEWGMPGSPANNFKVPGVQTWGAEQGPYLRNGETFEVRALLGAGVSGASLTILMEGILTRAGSAK